MVIPANTRAEIWIPAKENSTLTEGGQSVKDNLELKKVRYESGYAIVETGSGKYAFESAVE